jgi:uncharacterized protein (TIGR03437 family)
MKRVLYCISILFGCALAAWAQAPVVNGVLNAVSGQTSLAPGLLASIYGTNLTPVSGNTTVTLGGVPCFVVFVSANQVNIQLPTTSLMGPDSIVVTHDNLSSDPFSVVLDAAAPAFQTISGLGDFLDNAKQVTASAPATAGDLIVGIGVGFGTTNPLLATGTTTPQGPPYALASPVTVTIAGQPATGTIGGNLVPGTVGVYAISFTIPATLTAGLYPVVATVEGVSSPAVTLPVGIPTTTTLNSTGTPVQYGQSVTLMATVSPNTATGNVTFFDGVTPLGVAPLSSGVATLKTGLLAAGARSLTAFYDGNAAFMPGKSPVFTQAMTPVAGGSFSNPTGNPFSAGSEPSAVAVGDFNGDGIPDMAITNALSANVTIFIGNGSGGFIQATGSPVSVGNVPNSIVAGDFDGNGTTDLAVANYNDETVSILLGNGSGQFVARSGTPPSTGPRPYAIVMADFNADGIPDLATTNIGGTVTVLLGARDGTFTPVTTLTAQHVSSIAVGDFNGDSIADLALTGDNVYILLGNGDGTFRPATGSPIALMSGSAVATGDFDGDGNADLAILEPISISPMNYYQQVTILLGDGSGRFSQTTGSPIKLPGTPTNSTNVGTLAIGDFNADGNQDLVITSSLTTEVSILLGTGKGAFTEAGAGPFAGSAFPLGMAVADFNGDGRADAAVARGEGGVSIFLGAVPQSITFNAIPTQIFAAGSLSLTATASSGLAVQYVSNASGVCTVAGEVVTFASPGTCSMTASQPGNTEFAAAPPITVTFTIDPAFADVSSANESATFIAAIDDMLSNAITSGCTLTPFNYCPGLDVTRGQMAVFIVRSIYGSNNFPYNPTPYFTDAVAGPATNQDGSANPNYVGSFFPYIQKMKELGITSGTSATLYSPNLAVTRGQMAVFIIRARYGTAYANSPSLDAPITPYFTDAVAGPSTDPNYVGSFFPFIQKMKQQGITSGTTATAYSPNAIVTRDQMAVFVMRGGYNLFLPGGSPIISSASPATAAVGTTVTVTITGQNTHFAQALTAVATSGGSTVGTVTVNSSTSLTAQITILAGVTSGPISIIVTTPASSAPEEAVAPNALTITTDPAIGAIGYWSGNGTTVNSISSLSGALTNGAGYAPSSSRNQGVPDPQAFSFDGTSSYVQAATQETAVVSGARTLAAWVYPNADPNLGQPILTGGTQVDGVDIFGVTGPTGTCNTAGSDHLYIDAGGTCYISDIVLTPAAWSLVAVTFDGSKAVFYINGETSVAVPVQMNSYGLATYEIGGNTLGGSSTSASFSGLIGEVQVYNRALTPAEIIGLSNTP